MLPLVASSQPNQDLPSQIESLEKTNEKIKQDLKQNQSQLDVLEMERAKTLDYVLQMKAALDELDPKKKSLMSIITKDIDSELEKTKIPLLEQRKVTEYRDQNRYRGFLKCLKRNLSVGFNNFHSRIDGCRPRRAKAFDQSNNFLTTLFNAKKILAIDYQSLKKQHRDTYNKVRDLDTKIGNISYGMKKLNRNLELNEETLQGAKVKYKRANFLLVNKDFYNCNPQTPTIDLEQKTIHSQTSEKGPFYSIPRDHQDGVGTCYANTAKNLLIGLSDGKLNASFLDMALQYKSVDSGGKAFDLDGGFSCNVLDIIKDIGYCPKKFSPIESGDENQMIGGLFNDTNSLDRQADVIAKLKNFLNDKSLLEKNTDSCSSHLVKNAKKMVEALKNNPRIKLPYPEVPKFFLDDNRMRSIYHSSYKNKVTSPVSEEVFLNDFNSSKSDFSKNYLEAATSNDSPQKLRARFDVTIGSFFKKYNLTKKLDESYNKSQLNTFFQRDYDETFKTEALQTDLFYKDFFNSSSNDTINVSYSNCLKDKGILTTFLSGLNNIANLFRSTGGDTNVLFDTNGNFISNYDIMTLAVAPKCLNKQNRIKPNFDFQCKAIATDHSLDLDAEVKNKREVILTSLLEGMPVGNSHPQPGGNHINTIVGYRYNKSLNKCEYKIRESQTATSFWSTEESIIKINLKMTIAVKQ
jgi:hypothetical protein